MARRTIIRLRLDHLATDPTKYKLFSPVFGADEVYVDVPVDSDEVTKVDGPAGPEFTLSLAGLKILMKEVAHTIYTTNKEFDSDILKSNQTKRKK